MIVYLVGYRCTGKSTIGRALAARLGFDFVDADEGLVARAGRSIAETVSVYGWERFRAEERGFLESLRGLEDTVVATGGGVVLDPRNIRTMRETGFVIALRRSAEGILRSMARDEKSAVFRPPLTDKDAASEVAQTLLERGPLYGAAADFETDTEDFDIERIVDELVGAVGKEGEGRYGR